MSQSEMETVQRDDVRAAEGDEGQPEGETPTEAPETVSEAESEPSAAELIQPMIDQISKLAKGMDAQAQGNRDAGLTRQAALRQGRANSYRGQVNVLREAQRVIREAGR